MLRIKNMELLKEKLGSPQKIVITTHHKPDGDALGSSLGLYHFLIQLKHQVQVIAPTDYPSFLNWMPGNDFVWNYEDHTPFALKAIAAADIIFCLDFNNLSRINDMAIPVKESKALKVLVDHHLNPQDFEDITYANIASCSTAILIYQLIVELNGQAKMNSNIASCIYAGIMTDTGGFRFDSTTAEVHKVVAELIEYGANGTLIYQNIFDTNQLNRVQFIGYCLAHKLTLLPEYNAAYIAITAEELKKYKIETGGTEGLENWPLSIEGVRMAALIVDRTKLVKLSLRSKGNIAVNEICAQYFNGGGHKNASGGNSMKSLDETVLDFINLLPNYKHILTQ
jgi:phosphoesterase RecJ-like protein